MSFSIRDVIDIEDGIQKIWTKLVTMVSEGNPTVFQLLKRSKYSVDGSRLIIDVPGELGGEIMRACHHPSDEQSHQTAAGVSLPGGMQCQ